MSSYLDKKEGIYTPGTRWSFTNITAEPFESKWGGIPVLVGPDETIEISDITPFVGLGLGECLSIKMTGELVDRIMMGVAKLDEVEKNQPYYRSPKGGALGVPAARKPWEDKILRRLETDEDSTETASIRAQFKAGLEADMSRKEGISYEDNSGAPEFVNIPKGGFSEDQAGQEAPKPAKKAAKTVKIKTPKSETVTANPTE